MANSFSKEERVAFENILEGFNDALVMSRNVSVYNTDGSMMERTNDVIWRPQPYIATSINGAPRTDISTQFVDFTQLAVPATLGFNKTVPFALDALELRDQLQEGRLGDSAKQKLASDINVAIMNVAAAQSTMVVTRSGSAGGYSDVAECDAVFNEQGVQMFDRYLALSSRSYNGMASDLAGRQTMTGKPTTAYERSFVGEVAGFQTYKMDYANRILGNTTPVGDITINGANQYYTPRATSTAGTGETANVDNRYQSLNITLAAGAVVRVGDCFKLASVNALHHITKGDTGQAKTFRIISITSGGGTAGNNTVVISPPIISAQGGTDAELQYKNVSATPANGSTVTILNVDNADINVFWQKDALEILPGRYAIPTNAGVDVMRGTTDQGIELVMQKFYDINTAITKYRMDTFFGVVNKQPEMSGIMLFNQVP
ncbi:coat protein [uncultured Caudovirales phage]|uniref:Coat protein n=1 Tax=uncultured Caudovirales phage TaxID=2100421 RepID=A0A6J5P384_9CAUD|nr:coat protein [uncultured Caudovirales phage]